MKKVLVNATIFVLTFVLGMLVAIILIANGMHLSIPRIHVDTWTDNYDLQLNVAADSNSPVTDYDAVASK